MIFTIDLDLLQIIEQPGYKVVRDKAYVRRADTPKFEVQFARDGVVVDIGLPEVFFSAKAVGNHDQDPALVEFGPFTKSGSGDTAKWTGTPSFNTATLNTLLGVGAAPDVTSIDTMGEFSWIDGPSVTSTRKFTLVIENDVYRTGGDLPAPSTTEAVAMFLPAVTSLDGGGATAMDGLNTTIMSVPRLFEVVVAGVAYKYLLRAGTDAESATIIRPADFHVDDNPKVFERVDFTAPSAGEANTLGSQGTGVPLHLPKVGVDLRMKTLVAGANITLTPTAEEVVVAAIASLTNPMTTLGDSITGGASGTPTRLPIGTEGQVKTVVSGVEAWADNAGGGAGLLGETGFGFKWTRRVNLPSQASWLGPAWSGTVLCIVGTDSTKAATSTDGGVTWTQNTGLPAADSWTRPVWNGTVFCVIGRYSGNSAATSPDGITWTARTLPASQSWRALAWNGTVFCAVGQGTTIATSPDGITWTPHTVTNREYVAIAARGTLFATVVNNSTVAMTSSDNGTTWIDRTMPTTKFRDHMAASDDLFITNHSTGYTSSEDGITWVDYNLPGNSTVAAMHWTGEMFVIASNVMSGRIFYSADGVAWSVSEMSGTYSRGQSIGSSGPGTPIIVIGSGSNNWTEISSLGGNLSSGSLVGRTTNYDGPPEPVGAGGSLVMGGGILNVQEKPRTWVSRTMPSSTNWKAVAWNGSVFCAISNTAGTVAATSPDGITWTARTLPASATWVDIKWNGTVFLAISTGATGATSPDGVTWTSRTLPTPALGTYKGLAWNGSTFCAAGPNASVATSADGITWAAQAVTSYVWESIAVSNTGLFCIVTDYSSGISATSTDGVTWTYSLKNVQSSAHGNVEFCNGVFGMAVTGADQFFTSTDGLVWSSQKLPTFATWGTLSTDGTSFFLPVDGTTALYTSVEGRKWNTRTKPTTGNWRGAAFNGAILVVTVTASATATVSESIYGPLALQKGIASLRSGTATLVAGTVTVSDALISANTRIFVNRQTDGGTVGDSYSITRTAGTSFTITAMTANAAATSDTSVVAYMLIEP